MSIEVRWPVGSNNEAMCNFGDTWEVIEHTIARPDRDEVGHLMLISRSYISHVLANPQPQKYPGGSLVSITLNQSEGREGRLFLHIQYSDQHWTWELHEAHLVYKQSTLRDIYVGRWPD